MPSAIAATAPATAAVSCALKAPRWNRPVTIGSASSASPTAAGSARPSAISKARDCAAADAARSSARTCAAMAGVITDAMAIDTTPSGNS